MELLIGFYFRGMAEIRNEGMLFGLQNEKIATVAENPHKKHEKTFGKSLFGLNFKIPNCLHHVMHGEDHVNGMRNRASSAHS